jgi:hypothetical protein
MATLACRRKVQAAAGITTMEVAAMGHAVEIVSTSRSSMAVGSSTPRSGRMQRFTGKA